MELEITDQTFERAAARQPFVRELSADLETPISIYLKLRTLGPSFLLESVTGGEQVARYSFIGVKATRAFVYRGSEVEVQAFLPDCVASETSRIRAGDNPFDVLRRVLRENACERGPGMPRLAGGLVGYMGYEMARYFEPSIGLSPDAEIPEAIFLQMDTIVAFDHAYGKLLLISNPVHGENLSDFDRTNADLDELENLIRKNLPVVAAVEKTGVTGELISNLTKDEYCQKVILAKEHIAAGDIFQLVLSQRFERATNAEPFEIYRALRRLNPSPYMFFFDFSGLAGVEPFFVLGASPEMHARLEGRVATLRPIAGTRPRGKSVEEDTALAEDLQADPKERAEHVMLVDLGRNDLGRICEYGSVCTTEQMRVERYSHVMHLVSQVQGSLRPGLDAFDLLQATFPAGTVSGAPKVRAMQLIRDFETCKRNIYAGMVGYFSYDGAMDTCIAIRTLVMNGRQVRIQSGAGIVADSIPENEYDEIVNKARALAAAIEAAEREG